MGATTTWVDGLSGRVYFIPSTCSNTSQDRARAFSQTIFPQHGVSDGINSDRDPKFISKFWRELISLCSVKLKTSSLRHPQTEGASEVMNRLLESYCRCFREHKRNIWDI